MMASKAYFDKMRKECECRLEYAKLQLQEVRLKRQTAELLREIRALKVKMFCKTLQKFLDTNHLENYKKSAQVAKYFPGTRTDKICLSLNDNLAEMIARMMNLSNRLNTVQSSGDKTVENKIEEVFNVIVDLKKKYVELLKNDTHNLMKMADQVSETIDLLKDLRNKQNDQNVNEENTNDGNDTTQEVTIKINDNEKTDEIPTEDNNGPEANTSNISFSITRCSTPTIKK